MKTFKQFVRQTSKVVGGLAGIVFIRAPFTDDGLALMAGSVVVGIACIGAYSWAESDDDDAQESN